LPTLFAAFPRAHFLDVDFAKATMPDVLGAIERRQEGAAFGYIVTPNVHHVVRLFEQAPGDQAHKVRQAYAEADLVLCDSRVLSLLARPHAIHLPVVPGSDLTLMLLERAARAGDRITIVGGSPDTLPFLRQRYPDLLFRQQIPPMGLRTNAAAMQEAARFVAEAPARFTFLAVGSPQQELLALAIKQAGDATGLGFCIGASIDFIVGRERRAPRMVQKLALEWLYRLAQDPARLWRRYLVEAPRIFPIVTRWRPPR
jgi:N-acetylglucosaminyldiphosphoundecaprenol N-acetyl-beta-D-mannosaminyltransferase